MKRFKRSKIDDDRDLVIFKSEEDTYNIAVMNYVIGTKKWLHINCNKEEAINLYKIEQVEQKKKPKKVKVVVVEKKRVSNMPLTIK